MAFPSTAALLADKLGAVAAAAYDLSAGCTGFMYALAQAYGMLAGGLARRALVVGGDLLSRILDWEDRATLVLFGDGAGAAVLEEVSEPGFLGFELGADGAGGANLWLPGSGSRLFDDPDQYVKMNGREVYKFATRILVQSAQDLLERCGVAIEEVDVYVPHQANVRIIDHATKKLGVPSERVVVNVDRYGNTSSGSIPLALADAAAEGRLEPGRLVLMTGMGAGLTWGSALLRWTGEAAASPAPEEQSQVTTVRPSAVWGYVPDYDRQNAWASAEANSGVLTSVALFQYALDSDGDLIELPGVTNSVPGWVGPRGLPMVPMVTNHAGDGWDRNLVVRVLRVPQQPRQDVPALVERQPLQGRRQIETNDLRIILFRHRRHALQRRRRRLILLAGKLNGPRSHPCIVVVQAGLDLPGVPSAGNVQRP